jgi:hypothetical protein
VQSLANHFSLVSSSMSHDAKTKANTLKQNAERRAYKRKHDQTFAEKERLSDQRYRDNNKWGRAFICAYPEQFDAFRKAMIAQAMETIRR